MTQNSNNIGIINSWSLIAFAKAHGKMQVGEFANKETGETFKSCIFSNGEDRCFVAFSSKMGELTPREIAAMKDDLQVVQLKVDDDVLKRRKESGYQLESYILCNVGENSWEEVDLGL